MPVRDEVRDTQRTLVVLDAAHSRAVARFDQAVARRAEVLTEQDRLVAVAQAGVEQAVADMATGLGAELTAQLLGLDSIEVRRLAKTNQAAASSSGKAGRR